DYYCAIWHSSPVF
nr:immunoglobulin light chain junction region [Macaca mulatta]